MQIRIKDGDHERYVNYSKNSRARGLAFLNALFKIRNENHVQCVVIGDVGQGKSTTATMLAKYDTIFTRELLKHENWNEYLKYGDKIHFNLLNHVIISPKDPAKKAISDPRAYNSYESDEGYLWATTSEANTRATKEFIENIIQNRKLHPSFYHVYQNLFKMPSRVLELMNEVLLKLYVNKGALLIPTRMIQLAEKFDREKLEQYARNPKTFEKRIQHHPAFVSIIKTPRWSETFHVRYLAKYEKYKIDEGKEERKKVNVEAQLFTSLDKLSKQKVVELKTKGDAQALIQGALEGKMSKNSAESMSALLADRYVAWKENQAIGILSEQLNSALSNKLKFAKFQDLLDAEGIEQEGNG